MSIVVKVKEPRKKAQYAGNTVVFPYLGSQKVSEAGTIEVEDHNTAHEFIKAVADFTYNDSVDDPKFVDESLEDEEEETTEDIQSKSFENELGKKEETQELNLDPDEAPTADDLLAAEQAKLVEQEREKKELEEMIEGIKGLNHAQLVEQAKAFPGGEWRGKKKEQIAEYLIGKLTEKK